MSHPVRNLVVALRDQASGHIAALRAMSLARPGTDIVHLVHVERLASWRLAAELMQPRWMSPGESEQPKRQAWIHELADAARANGQRVEVSVRDGSPAKEVSEYATEVGADLIVVAGPRDNLARELFIGSTASAILRSSSCPVLVARRPLDDVARYNRIMVTVDYENEEMAYRIVQSAAAFFGAAEYHMAYAYRVPEEHVLRARGASEDEIVALRQAMQPRHENALRPLLDSLPGAQSHVEHGYPSSVLLGLNERLKPEIIVIGKHRGSGIEERVVGSVTQFLLYACKTDFLLIG
jgi:CPA2 family monovalent cation:H+ antiporter-2